MGSAAASAAVRRDIAPSTGVNECTKHRPHLRGPRGPRGRSPLRPRRARSPRQLHRSGLAAQGTVAWRRITGFGSGRGPGQPCFSAGDRNLRSGCPPSACAHSPIACRGCPFNGHPAFQVHRCGSRKMDPVDYTGTEVAFQSNPESGTSSQRLPAPR